MELTLGDEEAFKEILKEVFMKTFKALNEKLTEVKNKINSTEEFLTLEPFKQEKSELEK